MSISTAPLIQSLDKLRSTVNSVRAETEVLVEQATDMIVQTDAFERLMLPGMSFDPDSLEGLNAAQRLFEELEEFPDRMQESQAAVFAKIATFDQAVREVATFDDACRDMLEDRQEAFEGLKERLEELEAQILDDINRLIVDTGEGLEETFSTGMTAAGQATFTEVETQLKDAFGDYDAIAQDVAEQLESTADQILQEFSNSGEAVFENVIEARVRKLVEAQLIEVVNDLGLSQVISTTSSAMYQSIATSAPNLIIALKAVDAVKSILEAMKV